jgi:hypothetical protein
MSNIDINSFNYSNSLIFLNTYSFYIKCIDIGGIEKKNTHYFIFSLKENGLVDNYGLDNKLLVNSNNEDRKSKTYVDIYLDDNNKTTFYGYSYTILDDSKGVGDIFLDSSDKKPAKFTIQLNQYEKPFYTLEIDSDTSEYFSHIGMDSGKIEPNSDCNFDTTLQDLAELIKMKTELDEKEGIKFPSKPSKSIERPLKSDENKQLIINQLKLQKKTFDCLYKTIKYHNSVHQSGVSVAQEILSAIKNVKNFILDDNEYATTGEDDISKEISSNAYLYQKISKHLEKMLKSIIDDTPKKNISPEINLSAAEKTSPEINLSSEENTSSANVSQDVSVTSPKKVSVRTPEQEFEFKLYDLEKDVKILYNAFKESNFVDSDLLLLKLLSAEDTFLTFLVKESKPYRNIQFKDYLNSLLKSSPEFMILNIRDKRLQFKEQTVKEFLTNNKYSELLDNLTLQVDNLKNIAKKIIKGGASSILDVEVELSKQNDLDFNSFLEKTIYIKPDKRLMYTSVSGSNKIPIIGYFTIGKNLLLKMIEYQTNNKGNFASEEQLEEIKKRDEARRKKASDSAAGGGEKRYKKYYKTKNKRYYKLKTKKRR